jgi:hypothetical protein
MGPWDPNWRPDPTGRRLEAMRHARRGAWVAAVIFGALVLAATVVAPPFASSVPGTDLPLGALITLFSLPGLALLGAGLTQAALGSRSSAASAGLAIGIGSPVAAVTSSMIGSFIGVGIVRGASIGGDVAGTLLRIGVTEAVRISPLIALGSVAWVVLVRRSARPANVDAAAPAGSATTARDRVVARLRPGRGPRRRGG